MTAQNRPTSKPSNEKFRNSYDSIFGRAVLDNPEYRAAQNKKTLLLRGLVDNIANAPTPKCRAESLKSLEYTGDKIEPIVGDL